MAAGIDHLDWADPLPVIEEGLDDQGTPFYIESKPVVIRNRKGAVGSLST